MTWAAADSIWSVVVALLASMAVAFSMVWRVDVVVVLFPSRYRYIGLCGMGSVIGG
jgi:hypothetical protein